MSDYEDEYGSDFEDDSPRKSNRSVVASSVANDDNNKPNSRGKQSSISNTSSVKSENRQPSPTQSSPPVAAAGTSGQRNSAVPPMPSQMTPLQSAQMRELQRENQLLRKELAKVNNQLDEQLSRKGHKVGHRPPPVAGGTEHVSVLDKRRKENDKLRKQNKKVEQRLEGKDLARMRELQNMFGEATRAARGFKDENKSLENVYANQRSELAKIEKIESEMRQAKADASEEIREIKDETRRFTKMRDAEAAEMSRQRRQLERLEQKIRVQDQVGQTVRSVTELQEQVEEKDRTLESLKYQVAVLSKTNLTDKKRAKARSTKVQQQLQELREEHELLQEKLNARGIADDLGVY